MTFRVSALSFSTFTYLDLSLLRHETCSTSLLAFGGSEVRSCSYALDTAAACRSSTDRDPLLALQLLSIGSTTSPTIR